MGVWKEIKRWFQFRKPEEPKVRGRVKPGIKSPDFPDNVPGAKLRHRIHIAGEVKRADGTVEYIGDIPWH